jgi:cytochrome c peroxidase
MPYMHNGKFATLKEVLSHYEALAEGMVKPVVGILDPKVVQGAFVVGGGGGSPEDLKNLVEFLKTLTGTRVKRPPAEDSP